jgi:hypothetical protein
MEVDFDAFIYYKHCGSEGRITPSGKFDPLKISNRDQEKNFEKFSVYF